MDPELRARWDEVVRADDSRALQIELCKLFLRDYPDHGPTWSVYGRALASLSRFDEAEAAVRRAMELSRPQSLVFRLTDMGQLFRDKGDTAAAERWFRKAIDQEPDRTQGYIYLGAMLARLGRLAEAEEAHRRATLCPKGCVDEAYHNLGLVLRALERYDEALACFESALKIDPQYKAARLAKRDVQRALRLLAGEAGAD